ncbi:hypothetical protein MPLB_1700152 [Mesorhizobium sp. ORS 3324]|nr:hypothetical protein MPLB_1700152 [Mesorhizobium sp. ORS 3324]
MRTPDESCSPDNFGAASLEAIARDGSLLRRMAVRIPTYLKHLRENPAWLPMFVLARTMPGRHMHWLGAKRARALDDEGETMFAGIERKGGGRGFALRRIVFRHHAAAGYPRGDRRIRATHALFRQFRSSP